MPLKTAANAAALSSPEKYDAKGEPSRVVRCFDKTEDLTHSRPDAVTIVTNNPGTAEMNTDAAFDVKKASPLSSTFNSGKVWPAARRLLHLKLADFGIRQTERLQALIPARNIEPDLLLALAKHIV
jgi:hypothetical protein